MGVNKRPAEEETVAVTVIANEEMDVEVDTSDSSPPNAKKIKKSPPKKKKKSILGLIAPSQPKNPVALLNELRQNLIFDLVSQTGPVHAPVFTMKVAVDGVTYVGEGRSKKQAKLVAAKNALSTFLAQQQQQQQLQQQMGQFVDQPFPAIEFNRGAAVVDVDFTSDDPADANFIIDTMNRIQTAQIPMSGGPLTQLTGNTNGGAMKPPPTNNNNNKSGNEEERESLTFTSTSDEHSKTTPTTMIIDTEEKKKKTGQVLKGVMDKENHNDSGLVVEEEEMEVVDLEYDFGSSKVKEDSPSSMDSDDSGEEDDEEDGDVKLTPEILEIIRISVEHYIDYDEEVQNAAKQQKLIAPEKGPVMLLYELFSDIQFECMQTDGSQFSRFKMRVKVNDETFEGTGPSKRLAKTAAAKAALAQLRNISYSPMQSRNSNSSLDLSLMDTQESFGSELPQQLADGIGKMVQEKFAELMVGQEMYAKRKVLAGIVMTRDSQLEGAQVISVSTGTKCINGEHISIIGAVVNDCHAEIISRRCLMVFLYSQLRLLFSEETKATSIFEECPDRPEFYQLRTGIEFHLYINTAPCGDARIFSPHDAENNNVDKHPNRKARGQLRTKIESGEGTIPAKNNSGLQTWDGVIQGQRLLTMSCSDKIAKWNVMGIQGSLLASLVKPIYLSSIVLGSLLHPAHMYRAVCGRIETAVGADLPSPYYLNRPKLALVTSAEHRNQLKAPNFSVNWSYGDAEVEIINSVTGKTIQSQVSRISKSMFIVRYMSAAQHLMTQPPKLESEYGELKAAVKEYQDVKDQLYKAFEKEDLGTWLKKPVEQDQFTLQN